MRPDVSGVLEADVTHQERDLISQKVSTKWFFKTLFPQKSVNLSFITTHIKNKSTNLCENLLVQKKNMNTFSEIRMLMRARHEAHSLLDHST